MTKKEFIEKVNNEGFDNTMISMMVKYNTIIDKEYLGQLFKEAIDASDNESLIKLIKVFPFDAEYYIYDENKLIKETPRPIRSVDDLNEFFEEEPVPKYMPEYTIEGIQQYIKDNELEILDLFSEEELSDYIEDNWHRVLDTSTITEYVSENYYISDVYDEQEIINWVKEHVDMYDLIEVRYLW